MPLVMVQKNDFVIPFDQLTLVFLLRQDSHDIEFNWSSAWFTRVR